MKDPEEILFARFTEEDVEVLENEGELYEKFAKREGYSKKLNFVEASKKDAEEERAVLSMESHRDRRELRESWKDVEFFKQFEGKEFEESRTYKKQEGMLAVNRTLRKGDPYIMYTHNKKEYTIRKEKRKNGTDSSIKVEISSPPEKVGLFKNFGLFMCKDSIDIIDCEDLKGYRIGLEEVIDVGMPLEGDYIIPAIRNMKIESGMVLRRADIYFDTVDMNAGKITSRAIRTDSMDSKFGRVASTWHPQQYICGSRTRFVVIDTREKDSRVFWKPARLGRPLDELGGIEIEKIEGPRVAVLLGEGITTLDMRYLRNPFCTRRVPIEQGRLAVGKHVAVYNLSGEFFFQNAHNIDEYTYKRFNFEKREDMVGFQWGGGSGEKKFSTAAFLFSNSVRIISETGEVEYKIDKEKVKMDPRKLLKKFVEGRYMTKNVQEVVELMKDVPRIVSRPRRVGRREFRNSTTFTQMIEELEREATPEIKKMMEMPEAIRKVVPISKWMGTLVPFEKGLEIEREAIIKERRARNPGGENQEDEAEEESENEHEN